MHHFNLENVLVLPVGQSMVLEVAEKEEVWQHGEDENYGVVGRSRAVV